MEMSTKKYISPGGWFSLRYPETWNEFEDEEGSFLFYNPEKWVGNFRISVFKDTSLSYANEVLADERKWNTSAQDVKVGSWKCVYSCENFTESGEDYVTHLWMTGSLDTVAECSFSTLPGAPEGVGGVHHRFFGTKRSEKAISQRMYSDSCAGNQ